MEEADISRLPEIRLTLFISSQGPYAALTIDDLVAICRDLGEERCKLDVVDVIRHPDTAEQAGIVATPTLIRDDDTLQARVVGDLSSRADLATRILPELLDLPNGPGKKCRVIGKIHCA